MRKKPMMESDETAAETFEPNEAVIHTTTSDEPPTKFPNIMSSAGGTALNCDTHLYIGGRYIKYSRTLSQTPWFINKQTRKTPSSVEELITAPILRVLQPSSISFMSAGREDVDARCLGTGRPFALDLRGATVPAYAVDLVAVQSEINSDADNQIQVRDLCFVAKEDLRVIKEGEEEKTKAYRALCWSPCSVLQSELERLLCKTEPLIIAQTTPVRVLHRRTFSVRNKTIHWMRAKLVAKNDPNKTPRQIDDEHAAAIVENGSCWFYLDLCTQAGMYVKEFINGDFGRTSPSVMSILNIPEADCEALDVLEVNLPWPPSKCLDGVQQNL